MGDAVKRASEQSEAELGSNRLQPEEACIIDGFWGGRTGSPLCRLALYAYMSRTPRLNLSAMLEFAEAQFETVAIVAACRRSFSSVT